MQVNRIVGSIVLLTFALVVGCGGGNNPVVPPPPVGAAVSLTMTDAPPDGVTVLSFEVSVTSAVLNPGNVDLLEGKGPVKIEVKRLETERAFLNTFNVPAGTYNDITVGLANPEITLKNDGTTVIPGCTPDPTTKVCHITPPVSSNVKYSGPPFPLTLVANTPGGLVVDLNLANVLTSAGGVDFNAPNGVIVMQSQARPEGHLEDVDDLVGTVFGKDATNNKFTLKTLMGDLLIKVDPAATRFSDFAGCAAFPQNFTCVKDGQTVEVDARMQKDGSLVADKVELEDDVDQEEVEGTIVSIGPGVPPSQFKVALTEKLPAVTAVKVGDLVTVNIQGGAAFKVDNVGLTIPTDVSFSSANDLLIGQNVQVRRLASSALSTVNTDQVRLRTSRFTATVNTKLGTTFTVNNLPGLFTSQVPPVNTIEVRTFTGKTQFEPSGTSVSTLKDSTTPPADTVSVRGLLMKRTPPGNPPVLLARKVRKR